MRTTWTFSSAGQLVFGRNAVERLGEVVGRLELGGVALLVTDGNLAAATDAVRRQLVSAGCAVREFAGCRPEAPLGSVVRCAEFARQVGPSLLVAVGGGSNMDTAKMAATMLSHGGGPADWVGDDRIPGPIFPVVCVPTTAGTGSEVSGAAAFLDEERQSKVGMLSNYIRPIAAIVDPLLTLTCPTNVTADSGIDALSHAVEAYTAVDNEDFALPDGERSVYQGRHAFGDLFAEKAITLVGQYLRRAVSTPDDLEARDGMALAATTGGLAFSNTGVALVHALEYAVGGVTHCSHGAGNGLLLPHVMRFNKPRRAARLARVAALLGEDVGGLDESAAADRAVEAVDKLRADIGIPGRLRDLGARESDLRPMAEKSFAIKRLLRVNPRACSADDLEAIFRGAY